MKKMSWVGLAAIIRSVMKLSEEDYYVGVATGAPHLKQNLAPGAVGSLQLTHAAGAGLRFPPQFGQKAPIRKTTF